MAEEMKNKEVVEEKQEQTVEKTEPVKQEEPKEEIPSTQELLVKIAKLEREKNKASSEAADWKKKFRATQSVQEIADAEKAEQEAKRQEENEQMRRQLNILTLEKSYMAMGFTEDEASRMAVAEADNEFDTKMKILAEVETRKQKDFEAEFIKSRPEISAGVGGKIVTQEEFDNMNLYELTKLYRENPEAYARLKGKN